MLCSIKLENSVDPFLSNAGYVISACTKHIFYYDLTVKVTVSGAFFIEPVIFTCDGKTPYLLQNAGRTGWGKGSSMVSPTFQCILSKLELTEFLR